MPPLDCLSFDRFQVDPMNARLQRDGQPVALTPKAFDVLVFLCAHSGRLVGKQALLDAVWRRRFVSEGVLKNAIQELRQALGDDPRSPRFIETVHRRGYRFVGTLNRQAVPDGGAEPAVAGGEPSDPTSIVVGRGDALGRLRRLLELCQAGRPQTVFVSGEPGIGKTTLIRQLSATLPADVVMVVGQCAEQHGEVEPYLPFLEALNQLGRRCGQPLADGLRRFAPTWLAQLPWLQEDTDRVLMSDVAAGLSRERMQREMGAFLDHWSRNQPQALVLVLEDLHWSDHATVDAIASLARRGEPGRWLILGSYRPADALVNSHPLMQAMAELHLHRLCSDVALAPLPQASVVEYLTRRFVGNPLSDRLKRAIYRRTEGLPLFLVQLSCELSEWRERHMHCTDGEMETFFETLPESLQLFIRQRFDRLPNESQVLLDAAAVGGNGCSAAMLAAVTGTDLLAAEAWCERLAGSRHILMRSGPPHHPERRSSGRYAFIHAYYQQLAYDRVPLLRRASLHLAIAQWSEATLGARVRDLAAELAMHFEQGRDYQRALHYFRIAVENALKRHEPHAAAALSRRALDILERRLPASAECASIAVELYTTLATAVQITHGWADPEVQAVFARLLQYGRTLDDSPHWLPVLWAMMGFHFVCGQTGVAETHADRMLAAGDADPDALYCGHIGKGGAGMYAGRLDLAIDHFQASQTLGRPARRDLFPLMAVHPVVLKLFFSAQAYWLRGFPERARRCAQQGLAAAQAEAAPFSVAFIKWGELICRQLRGEAESMLEACESLIASTGEQGFALMHALAVTQRGWTLAGQERIDEALDSMHRGISAYRATGAHASETYLLANCVDTFLRLGCFEQADAMLDEAFELMEGIGERYFEAELCRLRGESMKAADPAQAERHFHSAIAVARRQGARSLELRAAMSLARLWPDPSRNARAESVLREIYGCFREGLETRDLRQAGHLLEALGDRSTSRRRSAAPVV